MQQSAIITTRRNDASLIARVTLDPNYPPESVTGDSLLDRVASAVNSAAGDLNVASIEVFPPAIVADTAILQHPDTVWSFLPVNIEGNACYTRKPSYDPFSYHPQDVAEGIVPADSEPVSEPKSEAIAGPKSQPKSEGESATADGPAIREVAAILGVDLDAVPVSCRSTERELPLVAEHVTRTAVWDAGADLTPAQADKLALVVAVGAGVTVDRKLPEGSVQVLISRHGEDARDAYVLEADGTLFVPDPLDDLEAIVAELRAAGVPADIDHPGFVFASVGPLEFGLDDWGEGPANAHYRICRYLDNELTQGNADAYSVSYYGTTDLGRSEVVKEFAAEYHEARREFEGVLDNDVADVALAKAVQALVPSAQQWHTGGGCYAVTATTPLGLFVTVATAFPPAVVTYSNGDVEAYDLGDETVGAWDFEQAVAGDLEEDDAEFTQARIEAFAGDFAEQFAWASGLEKSDPTPIGGGREHDDVRRIVAELEEADCTLVALAHEPGDEPFWTLVALRRRPVFQAAPYVVWSFNYSGISNGHYDLDRERAFRVFNDKVASREEV